MRLDDYFSADLRSLHGWNWPPGPCFFNLLKRNTCWIFILSGILCSRFKILVIPPAIVYFLLIGIKLSICFDASASSGIFSCLDFSWAVIFENKLSALSYICLKPANWCFQETRVLEARANATQAFLTNRAIVINNHFHKSQIDRSDPEIDLSLVKFPILPRASWK